MTDQTVALCKSSTRATRLRALGARFFRPSPLQPATAWALAALLGGTILRYFWYSEGELPNILFTAGITTALAALLMLVSRRILFSVVVTAALISTIACVASVKRATMNMVVHAY